MLHCNMQLDIRLGLEDVLAALWHARRSDDIARLAHVSYSEVQRWASTAHAAGVAARARAVLADCPYQSREDFMFAVDRLIAEVEQAHVQLADDERRVVTAKRRPSSETPQTSPTIGGELSPMRTRTGAL